jgi:hypothetical protein
MFANSTMKHTIAKIMIMVYLLLSIAWFFASGCVGDIVFWLRLELIGYPSWEANHEWHYMGHPLSLLFTLSTIALPISLLFVLLKNKYACVVAMCLIAYFPIYVFYGCYFHDSGFSPLSFWKWSVILTCIIILEAGLWWNYKLANHRYQNTLSPE